MRMLTYLFMKVKSRKMILKNILKQLRMIKGEIRLIQLIVGSILLRLEVLSNALDQIRTRVQRLEW